MEDLELVEYRGSQLDARPPSFSVEQLNLHPTPEIRLHEIQGPLVVFALAASLMLGGVLGYTVKPPVSVPARTQVIVVHDLLHGLLHGCYTANGPALASPAI